MLEVEEVVLLGKKVLEVPLDTMVEEGHGRKVAARRASPQGIVPLPRMILEPGSRCSDRRRSSLSEYDRLGEPRYRNRSLSHRQSSQRD